MSTSPPGAPSPQTTPGFDAAVVNSWHQNIKESEKLLAQLGYTKRNAAGYLVNSSGQELDGVLDGGDAREQRSQLALLIKQEEAKVGINLTIDSSSDTTTNIEDGNFAATASAHVEATSRHPPPAVRLGGLPERGRAELRTVLEPPGRRLAEPGHRLAEHGGAGQALRRGAEVRRAARRVDPAVPGGDAQRGDVEAEGHHVRRHRVRLVLRRLVGEVTRYGRS